MNYRLLLFYRARTRAALLSAVLAVLLAALLPACSRRSAADDAELLTEGNVRARNLLSVRARRDFDGVYLEALRQKYKEAPDAAFELLTHALDINPNDAEALYQQAMLVLGDEHVPDSALEERAVGQLVRATQLEPSNEYYLRTLASYWMSSGKFVRASRLYEMITARTEQPDDLYTLVSIYDSAGDPEAALITLDRYERVADRTIKTVTQRVKLLTDLGRVSQAFAVMRAFCDEHPDNLNYRLELADLYVRNANLEQGHALIEQVLAAEPGHGGALISLLAYYEAARDDVGFERQFSVVMRSPEVQARQKVAIFESMSRAVDAGSYDKFRLCRHGIEGIASPTGTSPLPEAVADFIRAAKLPDDSLEVPLRAILDSDSANLQARWQVLRIAVLNERFRAADSLCTEGRRLHPDELPFYYFGGVARAQLGHKRSALALFRAGARRVTSETDSVVVSNLYSAMGDAYHALSQDAAAFAAYDTALVYDRDNVECLNNYAYYLAVKGTRLPEAVRMAARAVEISPSEVSYIDTYAWALYRAGRYKEARTQMDDALALLADPADGAPEGDTLAGYYDRAGDIYAALGLRRAAINYWKRALLTARDKTLVRKLRRKVRTGKA